MVLKNQEKVNSGNHKKIKIETEAMNTVFKTHDFCAKQ